jgi:hypothetical protein
MIYGPDDKPIRHCDGGVLQEGRAPDTTGIHGHTAFRRKFGNVLVGEGISEVPADAQNNHLAREMTAFEGIERGDRHGLIH